MIETLTAVERMTIVLQGFAKIATNFWPVLLVIALGLTFLAYTESRVK